MEKKFGGLSAQKMWQHFFFLFFFLPGIYKIWSGQWAQCNICIHLTSSILIENMCCNLRPLRWKSCTCFTEWCSQLLPRPGYYWHTRRAEAPGVNKPEVKVTSFLRLKFPSVTSILYSLISKLVSISFVFYIAPFPNLLLLRCVDIQLRCVKLWRKRFSGLKESVLCDAAFIQRCDAKNTTKCQQFFLITFVRIWFGYSIFTSLLAKPKADKW